MIFLTLLLIPILIALGFLLFGNRKVTPKEFGVHLLVQMMFAGICIGTMYYQNTHDIETWNGTVSEKKREKVHCRHSYSCNCRQVCSGSGKDRSCYTYCDTCYEHSYDIDWNVYTNIGKWRIDGIDRRGLKEPPRWTIVQIGDPVSENHSYQNYIKGSPDTLFRYSGSLEKYKALVPEHPHQIYDYYKVNRVICINNCPSDIQKWNEDLSKLNSIVGYQKGTNIIIIFTGAIDRDYRYAIEQAWLGGKKNDIVIIMDIADTGITWAEVIAWTDNEIFKVQLRNNLQKQKVLDRQKIMQIIHDDTMELYKRKSMEDFAYLRASITPTPTQWAVSMTLGLIISIGLGIFFYREDVFGEQ